MTSFKIYFSEENIRRVRLAKIPSYEEFMNLLEELYPQFHVELVIKYVDADGDKISLDTQLEWEEMLSELSGSSSIKLYVEEGNGQYFKDGPEPEPVKFYADEVTKEAINVANEFMNELQRNVPECLSALFKSGKIIPGQIPTFLKDAVSMKYIQENVVDLDVDIPKLFDLLHSKALNLLNSVDVSDLEQGRDYLVATLTLVPDHMIALYNLACAESLLGNVNEAIDNLEKAVNAGYRDFQHMIQDADFANIKDTEAFQIIAAKLASLNDPEPEVETTPEPVVETIPEPVVETIPEPVVETIPEPVVETIPEPVVETIPEPVSEPFDLSESIMPLQSTYGEELSLLSEMGFTADPDVLLLLLEQYGGNVDEVAQFLLGFANQ